MGSTQRDPYPDKTKPSRSDSFLKYSGLGIQLLGGIAIAGWLGYKLDRYLAWKFPVFMLSFILIAFGGMLYRIYVSLNKE